MVFFLGLTANITVMRRGLRKTGRFPGRVFFLGLTASITFRPQFKAMEGACICIQTNILIKWHIRYEWSNIAGDSDRFWVSSKQWRVCHCSFTSASQYIT